MRATTLGVTVGLLCAAHVVGTASASAAYVDTVAAQTPTFYWRFNEASGSTTTTALVDNHATASGGGTIGVDVALNQSGAPALTPSGGFDGFEPGNTWFNFQATGTDPSGFIGALSSPLGIQSSTIGSASNWIKTTTGATGTGSTSFGNLYRIDAGATGALYSFIDGDGKFGLRISNGSGETTVLADVRTTGAYDDGEWHHVAVTWNESAGQAILYVDGGTLAGGETVIGTFANGTDFTSTGRHQFGKGTNNASRYQGFADELAIWDRALSATEVNDQFTAAAVPEPSAVGAVMVAGATLLARRRRRW